MMMKVFSLCEARSIDENSSLKTHDIIALFESMVIIGNEAKQY
jgi:hypothetical protein